MRLVLGLELDKRPEQGARFGRVVPVTLEFGDERALPLDMSEALPGGVLGFREMALDDGTVHVGPVHVPR